MNYQQRAVMHRERAYELANELADKLKVMTDQKTVVTNIGGKVFKFADEDNEVEPFYVDGTTWKDVCVNLDTIGDALAFYLDMVTKEA